MAVLHRFYYIVTCISFAVSIQRKVSHVANRRSCRVHSHAISSNHDY